jgi:hypothetical protein
MTVSLLSEGPVPCSCRCSEQSAANYVTVAGYVRVVTGSVTRKAVGNDFLLNGCAPSFPQGESWRAEVKGEGTANEDMMSGGFETSACNLAM